MVSCHSSIDFHSFRLSDNQFALALVSIRKWPNHRQSFLSDVHYRYGLMTCRGLYISKTADSAYWFITASCVYDEQRNLISQRGRFFWHLTRQKGHIHWFSVLYRCGISLRFRTKQAFSQALFTTVLQFIDETINQQKMKKVLCWC